MSMLALDAEVVAAWVALLGSIVAALISAWFSRSAARTAAAADRSLEQFKSRLEEGRDERDARRDYEYEARKRLYERCEPRLFAILEHANEALYRVFSLARTAKRGNLDGPGAWLGKGFDTYYLRSTVHRLLAPLVEARLLQRDLTLVDLSLDRRLMSVYVLGKRLLRVPTDAFNLAEISPPIPYSPNWNSPPGSPHYPQGFVIGELEEVLDTMAVPDQAGRSRCMTFGEFDRACGPVANSATPIYLALQVFSEFSPSRRPILWRLLLVEAQLCRALLTLRTSSQEAACDPSNEAIYDFSDRELEKLEADPADRSVTAVALKAARTHIRFLISEG